MAGYIPGYGFGSAYASGTGSYAGVPGEMQGGTFQPMNRTQNKSLISAGALQKQIDQRKRNFAVANMPKPALGQKQLQDKKLGINQQQQPSLLDSVLDSMLGAGASSQINSQNQIYSQGQMADAAEAEASEHLTGANLPWLANQAARPGMSVRSPGIISRVLPAYAQALSGAAGARVNVPHQMDVANRQFQTQTESAADNEALDWARIQQMLQAAQRGAAINNTGLVGGLIGQILQG